MIDVFDALDALNDDPLVDAACADYVSGDIEVPELEQRLDVRFAQIVFGDEYARLARVQDDLRYVSKVERMRDATVTTALRTRSGVVERLTTPAP